MTRDARGKSLSIGSYMFSRDCRFTTFSIVRSKEENSKQRASCTHQRTYKLSKFEIAHHQEGYARIGLYVALHKERFHLVVSGSDAMAIAAVKKQIAEEEYTRQRLQWIYARESALDSMTVHERSSYEKQYGEISQALRDWRESARLFSSFRWDGQQNSQAMSATGQMNPCLLCETGLTHVVPIMHFDISGMLPCQNKTFADSVIDMEAEITYLDIGVEGGSPTEQRDINSSRASFKRWLGFLQCGRAGTPIPRAISSQKTMLACATEFRARTQPSAEKLDRCASIDATAP